MADVRPFHGLRFDPAVVGDVGNVICPPYDIIDPDMQRALHDKSQYNIVRVEYGLTQAGDTPENNKYTRGAAALNEWLEQGAVHPDPLPSMYLHHYQFTYQGRTLTRRSLYAAVRIEEWEKGMVRPHEGTAAVFKADRLNLTRAAHANVSPILAMYRDPRGTAASVMNDVEFGEPLLKITAVEGESHTLWVISDKRRLDRLWRVFARQDIYIADGHHRYESALAYRNERREAFPTAGSSAAFNCVMMSLIELSDPGIVVLPTHRMVRGLDAGAVRGLKDRLATYFDLESVSVGALSPDFLTRASGPKTKGRLTLSAIGVEKDSVLELTLRDARAVKGLMPADRSEAYCKLDVSVLHHVILERLLGVREGGNIAYTRSELEAWQRVVRGEFQLAFLLNPVNTYAIKAVADAADKMPHKSTYFFPKEPAGLVLNSLDGEI